MFKLLRLENLLVERNHQALQRRIDQILEGIDALMTTPTEEWSDLELPPLAPDSADDSCSVALDGVRAHVARAATPIVRDSSAAQPRSQSRPEDEWWEDDQPWPGESAPMT